MCSFNLLLYLDIGKIYILGKGQAGKKTQIIMNLQ